MAQRRTKIGRHKSRHTRGKEVECQHVVGQAAYWNTLRWVEQHPLSPIDRRTAWLNGPLPLQSGQLATAATGGRQARDAANLISYHLPRGSQQISLSSATRTTQQSCANCFFSLWVLFLVFTGSTLFTTSHWKYIEILCKKFLPRQT